MSIQRIKERDAFRSKCPHLFVFLEWVAVGDGVLDEDIALAFCKKYGKEYAEKVLREFGRLKLEGDDLRVMAAIGDISDTRDSILSFIYPVKDFVRRAGTL
jgi:hypothetical protein